MKFTLTVHLNSGTKFSSEILDLKKKKEILDLYSDFTTRTVEKVDSCTQVVPDILRCLPINEVSVLLFKFKLIKIN